MQAQPTPLPDASVRWRPERIVRISPDDAEVWLFGGEGPVRLSGRGMGPMARAIDGERTPADLIAIATSAGIEDEMAERTLRAWIDHGHVTSTRDAPTLPVRAGLHPGAEDLRPVLAAQGVILGDDEPDLPIIVGVPDMLQLRAEASAIRARGDRDSAQHGATVIIGVQVTGDRPFVTPLIGPGHACATCLDTRLRLRRAPELLAAGRAGLELPPAPEHVRPTSPLLAAGAVVAKLRRLRDDPEQVDDIVLVIDPDSGRVEEHTLVRVPGCPECDPAGRSIAATHLDEQPADGRSATTSAAGALGLRGVDPEETWLRYRHHVSDVVGLVPVVEPVGPPELRAYGAGANLVGLDDPAVAQSVLRNRGGGKGITMSAARAGALAEALERESLGERGDEPMQRGRMADIDGAIHPNAIQLFSDRQMSEALGSSLFGTGVRNGHHLVPHPFDVEAEHDWSPMRSLTTGRLHWVPSSMVYLNRRRRGDGSPPADSNGAAAGNSVAEAIVQGLMELVERDAVALWWYPMSVRAAVDLDAIDDSRVTAARAPYRKPGAHLWALDLTTDLGIPAYIAISTQEGIPFPFMGAGAHTDPILALTRAITEASQFKASADWSAIPDPILEKFARDLWPEGVDPRQAEWVTGRGSVGLGASPDYPSIEAAQADIVQRLASHGLDVLWADLTRHDAGLPVVRTFVPGLRHFWQRLAPGRLYDVPAAQGWVDQPYDEDSLNPMELPL